jgi:UDP-N-acetylmuramoyl-tripeptide--D-alanyl-D-alanine ligase
MDTVKLYEKFKAAQGVSIDTRNITPGSVFFALKGENFNANTFAAEALKKGASYVVVDEEQYATHERIILVNNSLEALQNVARYHRSQLTIPVIGLTGSNGKTTSKELVNAVLSKKFKTFATKGNLNNHIGVPLSILAIDSTYEMAIIEMGANHLGEIALLCSIANPTHGLITNIGKAHIGMFGGFENIIRAKSELYHHLITTNGTVFINSQDVILANMAKRFKDPVFYPAKGDFFHCEFVEANPFVKLRTEQGLEIATHMIGAYNFQNIAAALCIGKYFGVDTQLALQAVAGYSPQNMRSQVIQKGNNTIILDAYNANPTSMAAAIETMADMKVDRKVLILGDMFELEQEAEKEHKALGKLIAEKGFTEVYLCGKLIRVALNEFPKAYYFETRNALLESLKHNPIKNATILIKASRGIGLEVVADVL